MKIERSALVTHTALEMYRLVVDVDAYPRFLRWCKRAVIHEQGDDFQVASLVVSAAGLQQKFTTRNDLDHGRRLTMRLVEGPFQNLYGRWDFAPVGNAGCRVSLCLDFEFRRGLISSAFQRGFRGIADHMVQEFVRRADQLFHVGSR
ncbi:MAG: type II toxin-antitoxin system RatA family toxin [Xanthomonadales bacterium]|nr:type II toxin-antitoxin system RatA family toxin [Xanthomonadales bacterium]